MYSVEVKDKKEVAELAEEPGGEENQVQRPHLR